MVRLFVQGMLLLLVQERIFSVEKLTIGSK